MAEAEKWSTGLFSFTSHPGLEFLLTSIRVVDLIRSRAGGCLESAELFLSTCFCPCVIFGYNAEMLRDRVSALHVH